MRERLKNFAGLPNAAVLGFFVSMISATFDTPASAAEVTVPGTTVTFKPYIEGEGGYDTNPDGLFRKVESSFEKVEGGLSVKAKAPKETYELFLKAREVHFDDLDRENRWDFKAALDTSFEVSDTAKLNFGTYFLRDFFSLDRVDIVQSYGEYALREDTYRVKVEAKSHVEHNIGSDIILPGEILDDFNVSKGEAFDYSRTDGKVSAIIFTKSLIQPFAIYDFGNLDYYNQVAGASINRDANEQFVVAGVRLDFDKTFRVDIGGRYNHREFDDINVVKNFDRGFIDINAYWKPTDAFKATFIVERFLKEPSTSFGQADDVRSVGLTADYRIDQCWRLNLASYYDRVEAIGDDRRYNRYTTTAAITYEPNSSVEIFLSGLAKWVDEEVTDRSYSRFKIGSGVRYKF